MKGLADEMAVAGKPLVRFEEEWRGLEGVGRD
jgi:hypothetical protein